MSSKHIVIVGGGAAGLLLATRLGNTLGRSGQARITLADRSLTHLWKPMLHTIAAGTRDVHQHQVNFLAHAREHAFHFEPGELCALDRQTRQIQLAAIHSASGEPVIEPRNLSYDALVLALGSGANDFGVPGVLQHCHFIDSPRQAEAFNQELRLRLFRGAIHDEAVHIGVVGAGATGVELAAELSHLLEVAAHFGDPALRERLRLTLYEGAPRILAAFPEAVAQSSHRVLDQLGFTVRTNTRVVGIQAGGLTLQGEGLQAADLTVWAAGIKAPAILQGLGGLSTNAANQLFIRASLQTNDDDAIFAIGDCASLQPPCRERPLPASAQVATQQASHLALHLPGWLQGRAIPDFVYRDLGALVSLGKYNAYGTVGADSLFGGRLLRGWVAQAGHELLHRDYQRKLHGSWKTGMLWLTETLNGLTHPGIRLS